jgi:hypothetical protein
MYRVEVQTEKLGDRYMSSYKSSLKGPNEDSLIKHDNMKQ